MSRYRPVDPKANFPALEQEVLEFWRRARIVEKGLAQREGSPEWVFYEGPPTANGKPGLHHVEARTFKDLYPRYRTMTGHYVHRKAGWDCHGLPVELEVEKEIGTRTKRDIEAYGIAEFNAKCRESVKRYVQDWAQLTERIAFWINFDEAYWTMEPGYIESVWWALKELFDRGLLFKDDKVTAYCPRCGTALSDHEVAMGYTELKDPSVFVKFPIVDASKTSNPTASAGASLVAWTTTPWTLISNMGLAVDPRAPYAVVRRGQERLIVAEALVKATFGDDADVQDTFEGETLVGARYSPPFENADGDAHRVVAADFVSMDDGTGVVHMAPAFGAEDLEIGRREGWPVYNPVAPDGTFTDIAPAFVRGKFVKAADPDIIDDLGTRGLLIRAEEYEHTYPLCWRCDTPLLYYARPAWYVRTTARKDELLAANEEVNWYPQHIKYGRYGDWLANNVDWSLSRERYWGTPLPIWECPEGHFTAVRSLAELSELAGRDVTGLDPHRPFIDEVVIHCPECRQEARRVPDLIDVWFDAGAMPYAQWEYRGPGSDGEQRFWKQFPADYICEAIDQTRGWFYTLMAESVLLFGQTSYRNVVCLGHLVDAEGRKMSKRIGNTIDPWTVIDATGADALRWFLIASGSPWENRRISVEAVQDVVRRFLLTLWNTYAFYVTYANIDDPDLTSAPAPDDRPPLDRWVLSRLDGLATAVRGDMDGYDATRAARRLSRFVDDLSNWYVRRSRRRFWDPARGSGEWGPTPEAASGASAPRAATPGQAAAPDRAAAAVATTGDKLSAYATLEECLLTLTRLLAPFIPFTAEMLYRNLVGDRDLDAPESVHLTDYPPAGGSRVDPDLEEAMEVVRSIASLGRQVRTEAKIRVRQPLAHALIHVPGDPGRLAPLLRLAAEELNVKEIRFAETADEVSGWRAKPNFRVLGPTLGSRVQAAARALDHDDGTVAGRLARGEAVDIPLEDGEPLRLTPADVDLRQEARSGWGMAAEGGVAVALDVDPGPELRREGLVRELIHHVQNLRRSSGLDVTDRILLSVTADDDEVRAAVESYAELLASEVLARATHTGAPLDRADGTSEIRVDGRPVTLTLRHA